MDIFKMTVDEMFPPWVNGRPPRKDMDNTIKLGDTARDTITGFEGVVICDAKWLHGCRRFTLQPAKLDEKGAPITYQTFDEPQLEKLPIDPHTSTGDGGGPRPEPVRR